MLSASVENAVFSLLNSRKNCEMKEKQEETAQEKEEGKEEEEIAIQKVPLKTLFRYATGYELILLFTGMTVSVVTGAGLPLMSILQGNVGQSFIEEEIFIKNHFNETYIPDYRESDFQHRIMTVVYQYAALAGGIFLAANIQVTCFLIVCEQMSNRIRREFVKAILRQEIPWFDKNKSGTLATKLFDNLERVKEGTGDKIGLMLQFLSQFVTGFVIAFVHNWKLTLIMLGLTPLQAICGFLISKSMSTLTIMEAIKYGKAGSVAEEVLSSIRTVVAFNGLEREVKRYSDALVEARKTGILKSLYVGLSFGCMGLVNFSGFALAFYIGVGWVHSGHLTPGELLTVFFSVMMGSMALGQAGPQFAVLGAAQGAAASIFEVLDRTPEIDSRSAEGKKGMKIKGKIEIENVRFSYPTRPDVQVLNDLSFTVEPGETVALVGSSGCGKSTIVGLLLRYYDVNSGKITIDGHQIDSLNIEFLRQQIAVVSQEPILFNCSIEENIKFGREDLTMKEMVEACRMANAEKFISSLPQGYNTLVGDRGTQLSGGQKQRIAIARALVRDPKILLLDEATSALDAESEGVVQHALDLAAQGRTTIIIAHRLSTIRNADKIIAMKNGSVVEVGTHTELLDKGGLYYDLVNAQTFTDAIDNVQNTEEISSPKMTTTYQTQDSVYSAISEMSTKMRAASIASVTVEHTEIVEEKNKKNDDLSRLKKEMAEAGVEKSNLWEIMHYASSEKHWLAIGFVTCILGGLVFPTYSVFFTQILDIFTFPPHELLTKGHLWALMFLVLAVIQGTTLFSQVFFFGIAAEQMTQRLRGSIFRNVLSQEIGYHDSPLHSSGKICTRLATDVPNLKAAIDFRLSTVLSTMVAILAGVGVAFYFGWQMAFLTLALFPIIAVGQSLRTRVMQGKHRQNSKDLENSGKVAMEAIENVRTVQALTREVAFYDKFCSYLDEPHKEAVRQAAIQGLAYGFASSAIFILNACAYRFGLFLILGRHMTPMRVLRVMYAISISATTLGFATSYFPEYMKARFAGGIIFNMLKVKPNIDNMTKEGKREKLTGAVTFKNVHFSYPERPGVKILKGLNFSVQPGQTLALVGPSGCGKSTVVSLIERFYDPASGQVLLDGFDLRTLNPNHVRSQIALVSQEPILFDCSIRSNIIYGLDSDISDNSIHEAAKKANIHSFIAALPEGYDTRVGDKGTQLSGGQKQRIAIARALIRNPKILLLDEATSALDTESEKIVQEALDRAREGRTCIVIAHRLGTIINADSIAVVNNGQIVEQGNHQELTAARGAYFELTQKQNINSRDVQQRGVSSMEGDVIYVSS